MFSSVGVSYTDRIPAASLPLNHPHQDLPNCHEVPVHCQNLTTEQILVPVVHADCACLCVILRDHIVFYTSPREWEYTCEEVAGGVVVEAGIADRRRQLLHIRDMACLQVHSQNAPAGTDQKGGQTVGRNAQHTFLHLLIAYTSKQLINCTRDVVNPRGGIALDIIVKHELAVLRGQEESALEREKEHTYSCWSSEPGER